MHSIGLGMISEMRLRPDSLLEAFLLAIPGREVHSGEDLDFRHSLRR